MQPMIDIITVAHRDETYGMMMALFGDLYCLYGDKIHTIAMDTRDENIGFAAGCNRGAKLGTAPIIGLLNPDVVVLDSFLDQVLGVFEQDPNLVITGNRFGKAQRELEIWGVRDWVCGATMFVRREFWEDQGGFDETFVWSHEETDLIRRAEIGGHGVRSIEFPFWHASPEVDDPVDAAYKRYWFEESSKRYFAKWRG